MLKLPLLSNKDPWSTVLEMRQSLAEFQELVKGIGSRYWLALSWHAWVDLGLRKWLWKVFRFCQMHQFQKPLRLIMLAACLSFLWVSAAGLWFLLAGRMRKFLAGIFHQFSVLRCFGLVGHQRQATQILSLGNYTPCDWPGYGCKKRRIDIH